MCDADWNALKKWSWNHSITENQANNLVAQGVLELKSIAHNFKKYFPNLFEGPYDDSHYHFQHTNTERTRSSFQSFFDELFGENAHNKINAEVAPSHPDLLLKPYGNCPLWKEQKKRLKQPNSEANKFRNSNIFLKLIDDINARLGLNGTIQVKQIHDIYDMCRYEQAWHTNKPSIWCSVSEIRIDVMALFLFFACIFYSCSRHLKSIFSNIKQI